MTHPADLETFPASFAQARLWFLDQIESRLDAYHISLLWSLQGPLNHLALQHALDQLLIRHESLRTSFLFEDGQVVQRIHPASACLLRTIPLSFDDEPDECIRTERLTLFDLRQGKTFRVILIERSADEYLLLITVHHIACDRWSLSILQQELTIFYNASRSGRTPDLPPLPIQYADFSVWQRHQLNSGRREQLLGYWRRQLANLEPLELPTDFPRPALPSYRGASLVFELDGANSSGLECLCQQQGATLQMGLLALVAVLLQRYSRSDDIPIGVPHWGRDHPDLEGLVGFFVNILVLRCDLSEGPNFLELLRRVRSTSLEAYEHQDLPFEEVVEALQPERERSRHPLVQVMVQLLELPSTSLSLTGLTVQPLRQRTERVRFDLEFLIQRQDEGLRVSIDYSTDLFDAGRIERLQSHLTTLFDGVLAAPERALNELPILTDPEVGQLLRWSQGASLAVPELCVHELFEQQVVRTPEAIALVFGEQQLSYSELNARANQLAHHLRDLGVRRDDRVALLMERSPALVVAILAILKAGAAYVPLHNEQPSARHARIMADAGVRLLLIDGTAEAITAEPLLVLSMDAIAAEGLPEHDPGLPVCSQQLAYVMFTSGSTGVPKGVAVTHSNIVSLAADSCWRNGTHERVLFHSPHAFDASTYELWVPLLHGGQVVVAPPVRLEVSSLADLIERHSVSGIFLTTALFNLLAELQPTCFGSVGEVWTGGEAVSPVAMERVRIACPRTRIVHVYGPTETTTFATFHPLPSTERLEGNVPIGKPMEGMRAYVLDAALRPSPVGVPGELYLAGTGLAQGYVGLPDLTNERFVADPFAALFADGGARMYRTGDLARWLPDGNLEFLGRVDFQVKIRGLRIEPGEIEMALRGYDGIRDAVVLAREDGPGEIRLVAYVTVAGSTDDATLPAVLKAHLRSSLPDYMVPSAFVELEALPLTTNGKLDRKSLPAPSFSGDLQQRLEPSTVLERQLHGIWAEVLGHSEFGISDNFFELGGHSLMALSLLALIENHLNQKVPLSTIFHAPTVETMCQTLSSTTHQSSLQSLVPIQADGHQPPIFAIHILGKGLEYYRPLARELGYDYSLWGLGYGLAATSSRYGIRTPETISELAAHYIEEMRTLQPHGPYMLLGFSNAGLVAYEMAKQLEQQGNANIELILLDTFHPEYGRSQIKPRAMHAGLITRAWHKISILWGDLLILELHERWPWFKQRLNYYVAKKIYARIAPRSIIKKHHAANQGVVVSLPRCYDREFYENYNPRGFQGSITLFEARCRDLLPVAKGRDRHPVALGWEAISSRGVETLSIHGDHTSILTGPGSRLIAKHLIAILERRMKGVVA